MEVSSNHSFFLLPHGLQMSRETAELFMGNSKLLLSNFAFSDVIYHMKKNFFSFCSCGSGWIYGGHYPQFGLFIIYFPFNSNIFLSRLFQWTTCERMVNPMHYFRTVLTYNICPIYSQVRVNGVH